MLPKLEMHFGDEVLRFPQNKRVNLIMCAYGANTLKENLLSCYKRRVSEVLKEQGISKYYHDVTTEEAEAQLLKDLKEFGDDFVFEYAWKEADRDIECSSYMVFYWYLSDEEDEFTGIVEWGGMGDENAMKNKNSVLRVMAVQREEEFGEMLEKAGSTAGITGKNTDAWIARETEEDRKRLFGISLIKEKYHFPMIWLHFGKQYLPIPQHTHIDYINNSGSYSLKGVIMNFYREEASAALGVSIEKAPKRQVIERDDPDMQVLEAYIGRKIYEEGPYVVLGRVIQWRASSGKEFVYPAEICYANVHKIGEIQNHEGKYRKAW